MGYLRRARLTAQRVRLRCTNTGPSREETLPQDSLTIVDNRTGQEYTLPITDGTIRATDLSRITAVEDDHGLMAYDPAYLNTASCRSAITFIDGDAGILRYRGYPIEQVAEEASFLETAYLLLEGELPTASQLAAWEADVRQHTYVHTNVSKFLEGFRYDAHPMGMLLGAVGALSTFYPDAKLISDPENRYLQRARLIAKMPTIAAFAFRHSRGLPYVLPRNDLGYIGNFVNMTFEIGGRHEPNPVLQRALEILFILHADHEQNCSTSAVRGVGSSHVDPFSAVSAGIAALYGPLHGGANEAVLRMLDEIGEVRNVPGFIEQVKAGRGQADGIRAPRLQELRPTRQAHQAGCRRGVRADGHRPQARDRARARTDRARGRVLRLTSAVPERRLLLRPDLQGDGLLDGLLHRLVRARSPTRAGSRSGRRC